MLPKKLVSLLNIRKIGQFIDNTIHKFLGMHLQNFHFTSEEDNLKIPLVIWKNARKSKHTATS